MASTIKVLQVIPKLGYGGAETGCYDLAHFLAEQNCKSFLITSGGQLLKYIRRDKVKVIRLPVQSKNPIIIFINLSCPSRQPQVVRGSCSHTLRSWSFPS